MKQKWFFKSGNAITAGEVSQWIRMSIQHISPVLRKLHWLPVMKRIEFKIITMTYKALNGMAPSYICDFLQVPQPNRNLCSASRGLSLVVPPHQT